jgi:nucleoside-diphosphate-sugar epimerase
MYHLKEIQRPAFLKDAELKKLCRGKRVLVLGGDGFLGIHVATAWHLLGAEVSVLSRRTVSLLENTGIAVHYGHLLQKNVVKTALEGQQIVLDFAGASGAVSSNQDAHRNYVSECEPHLHVFQCAAESSEPPLMVFCSSRTVYGKPIKLPVSETHPVAPISAYAIHKLMLEHYLQNFHRTRKLKYLIFRVSNPYGPYLWQEKKDYGVINQFILNAFFKQPIKLFGDGSQRRDYIHVDDAVEAFIRASVQTECHNRIFNLGGPAAISIKSAVETIVQARPGSEVRFEPWPADYQTAETGDYVTNNRRLHKLLPNLRQSSFEQGIERTLAAYERLGAGALADNVFETSLAVAHRSRRPVLPDTAYWAEKRVLVTGARGFLGSQIALRLLRMGAQVAAMSRRPLPAPLAAHPRVLPLRFELENPAPGIALAEEFRPEVIFHLAARPDGAEIENQATNSVNTNVTGTIQLLEMARRLPITAFVFADSAKVYGNSPVPHRENSATDPTSSYAVSKLAAWNYGRIFSRLHGLPFVALRPTLIYGPGQGLNIFTFLAKCLAAGMPQIFLDGGLQTRDPLYIDDAVNAYLRVAECAHRLVGRAIPIGGGVEQVVKDMAARFVRIARYETTVYAREDKLRPTEMMRSFCDNSDAWQAMQWRPETPIDEGLCLTASYLLQTQLNLDKREAAVPLLKSDVSAAQSAKALTSARS